MGATQTFTIIDSDVITLININDEQHDLSDYSELTGIEHDWFIENAKKRNAYTYQSLFEEPEIDWDEETQQYEQI